MNPEEQSRSKCSTIIEKDDHRDRVSPKQEATWKQLRLARFIFQQEVADFDAVVQAMQNREYKKVDEWKAEARKRPKTITEWVLPKSPWPPLKLPSPGEAPIGQESESVDAWRRDRVELYSRFIEIFQPGTSGLGQCESCAYPISIQGGYRIKDLKGTYHNRFCLEQGIFYKDDPNRKGSKEALIGSGELLRSYIDTLNQGTPNASRNSCAQCGGSLTGCRAGAKYCSSSCRQMAHSKASRTGKKTLKIPIKQGGYPSIVADPGMVGPIQP